MTEPLLKVENLSTRFFTDEGQINAVENISFNVNDNEVFGIVGESGSGKSVTALSLIDLVDSPGRITSGHIWYRNSELADKFRERYPDAVDGAYIDIQQLPDNVTHSLRGSYFSMIFQDPMSSFDPTYTVGDQIAEAVEVARRTERDFFGASEYDFGTLILSKFQKSKKFVTEESREEAIELLGKVGIPDPEKRVDEYPHEFSGGMLQRAMIAQALAAEPDLLIADEPTTALDVTIQAQVLDLLNEFRNELDTSIILITHNLGVIARMSDRVGVMYAGEIVERGQLEHIFDNSVHPYTEGLIQSIPDLDDPESRIEPIEGNVPSLRDEEMGDRCYFADRCPKAMQICLEKPPEYSVNDDGEHKTMCYLAETDEESEEPLPKERLAEKGET